VRTTRRAFLGLAGDFLLLAALPAQALAELARRSRQAGEGVFLSAGRLATLRALVAHFVPGPPEDPDPGAEQAGVAEYVDLLLGAFELDRHPRLQGVPIFAGGPFSHREGGGPNHFARFLDLDPLEERIWRTRIEGSRGLREREWNGPVRGWQEIYAEGLDRLEASARRWFRRGFAELSRWQRGAVLDWLPGGLDPEFVRLAFGHTLEGMYGAPEYGGNRGRVGWTYTRWPGDHQPHAWSRREIAEPDPDQAEAVALARARARGRRGAGDG
jgi:hypothetical protein